jgi:hypothetical protein
MLTVEGTWPSAAAGTSSCRPRAGSGPGCLPAPVERGSPTGVVLHRPPRTRPSLGRRCSRSGGPSCASTPRPEVPVRPHRPLHRHSGHHVGADCLDNRPGEVVDGQRSVACSEERRCPCDCVDTQPRSRAGSPLSGFSARLRVSHVCLPWPIPTAAMTPAPADRCAPLHFAACLGCPRPRQGSQPLCPSNCCNEPPYLGETRFGRTRRAGRGVP